MQCISSVILTLAATATLVIAAPAPGPMPEPTPAPAIPDVRVAVTSTMAQSTATPTPVLNIRKATIDAFSAKCSVGTNSVATCTGAIYATNVWEGVLDATVDSFTISTSACRIAKGTPCCETGHIILGPGVGTLSNDIIRRNRDEEAEEGSDQ
ncbi:hypothetical protein FJTKL_04405 [Diaporthe vaccinii]|uniref:Hydrophobin n=1 Tax=Diaporthe vaccinii TaxID=105482 RepID=A0ABR4DUA4_9PEZI